MDDLMKAKFSNLVKFVKPSSNKANSLVSCKGQLPVSNCKQPLSGNDAVLFYKDIISSHSGKSKDQNSKRQSDNTSLEQVNPKHRKREQQELCKHPSNTLAHGQHQNLNEGMLLTSSQNGDLTRVQACLTAGVGVNSQDQFGWTALMCAACSGQSRVVKHLLASGANTDLTASGGKTAASIASDAGHRGIMKLISDFDRSKPEVIDGRTRSSSSSTKDPEVQKFYCDVCKQDIKEASQTHHQASTVHLFNKKVKAKPHSFLEHSRNKGYQIMRRTGWDGEKGLGSEGQGQKFPVKTVIKKDRACLGSDRPKEKAKVTHFGPRDTSAVKRNVHVTERKMSVRTLSKRAQKAKERKQKQWEKKLRYEFNLKDYPYRNRKFAAISLRYCRDIAANKSVRQNISPEVHRLSPLAVIFW